MHEEDIKFNSNELAPAIKFREAGKFQEAQEWLQKFIKNQPNHAEAFSLLCHVLLLHNKDAEAEQALLTAASINSELESIYRNQARLLLKQSKPKEALKKAQIGYECSGTDPESRLVLAICFNANQRKQEALNLTEKVLRSNPNYAEAYVIRALIRLHFNDIIGSIDDAKKAVSLKPHLTQIWQLLGSLHYKNKNLSGAIAAMEKLHELEPTDINCMANLGEFLRQDERISEAITILEKAAEMAPKNITIWVNLGTAFQQDKQIDKAKLVYEKALTFNPKSAEISNNLGSIAKDVGDWMAALQHFENALEISPNNAEAHSNLGVTMRELGRLDEAEASYRRAIQLKPDYTEAMLNLSITLGYMNDLKVETRVLRHVLQIDAHNNGLRAGVNLAICNFLEGDFADSKKHLLAAAKIQEKTSLKFKSEKVYQNYLLKILNWHENKYFDSQNQKTDKTLYVIGESHSLVSHHLHVQSSSADILCKAKLIKGCKQWHLGSPTKNQYKNQFESIFYFLPKYSAVLLTFGEIDCRLDGGIIKHKNKFPEKEIGQIIITTVENYLAYIMKNNSVCQHRIIIQGVPCPNIATKTCSKNNVTQLIKVIKNFNCELKNKSKEKGFEFLDVHKLTDRGDGFSNAIWHIDNYHLSPDGMLEAWRKYVSG